ncbi:MAG TPA: aminoglycoside phosphotransferase family protein [Bryobacteraceae bacterium]|nr:aminoglycoside phosphotransferase family protein [Bryobacteraceae bacterium]
MSLHVPAPLASSCQKTPERRAWFDRLPAAVRILQERWSLTVGSPFDNASCAWVAPVRRADGSSAVLKIGMPHMEAEHETQGLRFWDGEPTVRLLDSDDEPGAMLLELCEPGTPLLLLPEPEQDVIIAGLLHRLWRTPTEPHAFRPLSALLAYWSNETLLDIDRWPDPGLVREGLALFEELARPARGDVLLATDLHAANVLRSERKPWLVIDPKPFIGDPAYDATQHLFNCEERLCSDPDRTISRVADLLGVDRMRVRLWTFARTAAEPRSSWDEDSMALARQIAP